MSGVQELSLPDSHYASPMHQLNAQHSKHTARIDEEKLEMLFTYLKANNVYAKSMIAIGKMDHDQMLQAYNNVPNYNPVLTDSGVAHPLQVAAFIADDSKEAMQVTFKYSIPGRSKNSDIPSTSELLEPLCYPLLHPQGERGWSKDIKKNVPWFSYMSSRMLRPERHHETGQLLLSPSKNNPAILWPVNRFQLLSRLGQHFVVESVARALDFQLNWVKNNQKHIFGGAAIAEDAEENPEDGLQQGGQHEAEQGLDKEREVATS